jgi:predicted DNA-binding transcriptional regulator AlpA
LVRQSKRQSRTLPKRQTRPTEGKTAVVERLLTTEEVAAYFRTVPATVRFWRHVGKGPRSFKVGRRVLYRESDVQAWQEAALAQEAS